MTADEMLHAATIRLPAPPKVPSVLANIPRPLFTPPAGMPAVDATIAPRKK